MIIEENILLKNLTTMRTGGLARFVVRITKEEDVAEALAFAASKNLPTMLIGGGSNMVAPDAGFQGVVLLFKNKGVTFEDVGRECVRVVASAGDVWDDLVAQTTKQELCGLENLSYIPGTVGGAVVQNVGAYGREAKDTLEWVEVFDRSGKNLRKLSGEECSFGYRDSIFKHATGKDFIIMKASFLLSKNSTPHIDYGTLIERLERKRVTNPTAQDVRNAVIEIRKEKLPEIADVGTAGSFFKNPIVSEEVADGLRAQSHNIPIIRLGSGKIKIPAAWLIEHAGKWKGYREGDVGVYPKHALVLVNYGNAQAHEIISLAEEIERDVFEKTNISLEREVIVWK